MRITEIPQSELTGYVQEAVRISREHVAAGGIPFSGLVVNNGRILGTGLNRVREDNDPTAHAEVVASLYFNVTHIVHAVDRRQAAQYGFDYAGSYSVFTEGPENWPIKATSLPVPDATKPFEEFLTMDRRHA
ncbi:nucleoside deaminase [Streptomyces sp. NPDC044571]|uniref:nucleoside deaminase n=1 Tax=Streptomyces sp. NPDC044571 TaxID=3155371 RepID=UPI0033E7F67C